MPTVGWYRRIYLSDREKKRQDSSESRLISSSGPRIGNTLLSIYPPSLYRSKSAKVEPLVMFPAKVSTYYIIGYNK